METDQQKHEKRSRFIKRLLLLFLVFTNIVLFYTSYRYDSKVDEVSISLAEQELLVDEIEETLKATETELIRYRDINLELNKLLVRANEQIEKLREEKDNIRRTSKNNEEMRLRLQQLQQSAEMYLSRIDSLLDANQQLTDENNKLRDQLVKERNISEELRTVNENLEKEIGVLSKVLIENPIIWGIKINEAGEETQTMQAKQCNKLKFCFDIAANTINEKEPKKLYFRLILPDGTVSGNEETGYGQFYPWGSNDAINYTTSFSIIRDKVRKNYCLYSEEREQFPEGIYTFEIYTDGELIFSYEKTF